MSHYELSPDAREHARRIMQAIYGSWVGRLVAQGRTDEQIREVLEYTQPAIVDAGKGELLEVADRARENTLNELPRFRRVLLGLGA